MFILEFHEMEKLPIAAFLKNNSSKLFLKISRKSYATECKFIREL